MAIYVHFIMAVNTHITTWVMMGATVLLFVIAKVCGRWKPGINPQHYWKATAQITGK